MCCRPACEIIERRGKKHKQTNPKNVWAPKAAAWKMRFVMLRCRRNTRGANVSAPSGLSSPRLTNDKPQLSCLEPPTRRVTQPHLVGLAGYDISPPAKNILLPSCPSKKEKNNNNNHGCVESVNLLGFYTVKQFLCVLFCFYVLLYLLSADVYRLANDVVFLPFRFREINLQLGAPPSCSDPCGHAFSLSRRLTDIIKPRSSWLLRLRSSLRLSLGPRLEFG